MNATTKGKSHRLVSVKAWEGEYTDKKKGAKYRTVLCDWKCLECGMEVRSHPENLGVPVVGDDCQKGR